MSHILSSVLDKAIWAILCFICAYLYSKLKAFKQRDKEQKEARDRDILLVKEALRHTLRQVIKEDYDNFKQKGFMTQGEYEEFEKTYTTYRDLGGNGVIEHLHKETLKLPIK